MLVKLWISLALAAGACAGGVRTCAAQQQRVILWEPPPVIGVYSPTLQIVADVKGLASSEWPNFLTQALAELAACSRLDVSGIPGDYTLWTVDAPVFNVLVGSDNNTKWQVEGDFIGFTFPLRRRIYVAQAGVNSKQLIKHELLHALLNARGFDPRHNTPVADGMFRRCKLVDE